MAMKKRKGESGSTWSMTTGTAKSFRMLPNKQVREGSCRNASIDLAYELRTKSILSGTVHK